MDKKDELGHVYLKNTLLTKVLILTAVLEETLDLGQDSVSVLP